MPLGAVVQSIAGRDRYRLFVIIGMSCDGYALIADGRLHPISSPKRKNLRHLKILAVNGCCVTSSSTFDDKSLYTTLGQYEANKKS